MPPYRSVLYACFALAIAALGGAAAFDTEAMPQGRPTSPPAGFISFCMREPSQCLADGLAASVLHLDKAMSALLGKVNDRVNRTAAWDSDQNIHGRREYFGVIREGSGDCDDMVVTKRALLHEAGIPLHDLRIAIAATPKGEQHAVLVVTTDQGELVLDTLDKKIRGWRDVNYSWIKRQDGSAMGWVTIPAPTQGLRALQRVSHRQGSLPARLR